MSATSSQLDTATEHSLLQILGDAISIISEKCWCAGWLGATEKYVPELCRRAVFTGVPQKWGLGQISPEEARGLCYLAGLIGAWADLDERGVDYVPYQPFPIPADVMSAIDLEQTKA